MYQKKDCLRQPLIFFLIALGVAAAVWLIGLTMLGSVRTTRARLQQELQQLPVFDRTAEMEKLTAEYHLSPASLQAHYPTPEELNREIEKQLLAAALLAFNPKLLQEQIAAVKEEYDLYPGKIIKISYHNEQGTVDEISGKYEGGDNTTVFINGKSIKMKALLPESRSRVKPGGTKLAAQIKKMTEEFDAGRKQFLLKHRRELENSIFTAAGYMRNARNEWLTPPQFVEQEISGREQQAAAARTARIAALQKQYRAWGIVTLQLEPHNSGK